MKNYAFVCLIGSVLLALKTQQGFAGTITYDKWFFVENPKGITTTATLLVGAEIETWANKSSSKVKQKTFTVLDLPGNKNDITKSITHCEEPEMTASDEIGTGFPMTHEVVLNNFSDIIAIEDKHKEPNKAFAEIRATGGVELNFEVWDEPANRLRTLNKKDMGIITLKGFAMKGDIIDSDQCHSANSVAAVHIGALEAFTFDGSAKKPKLTSYGKNTLIGFAVDLPGKVSQTNAIDPFWVTLTDLDTGESTTEIVMSQVLESVNATFSIDDTGILLSISDQDPESFVSLTYTSDSDWVATPYSYSYKLDSTGLSVLGNKFPLSGWTVTSPPGMVSAFFPFGSGGQPFDIAEITPPDEFLTQGHAYRFEAGASEGVWEAVTVPEPGSLSLMALGAFGLFGFRYRQRSA